MTRCTIALAAGRLLGAMFFVVAGGSPASAQTGSQAVPRPGISTGIEVQPGVEIRVMPAPASGLQAVTPRLDCRGPDPVACAKTEADRHLLLTQFYGLVNEEQSLQLIAQLKDVNAPNPDGSETALSVAIGRGYKRAVAALLKKGADPWATDRTGHLLINNLIDRQLSSAPALEPDVLACLRLALEHAAARAKRSPSVPLDATLVFRANNQIALPVLDLLLQYGADPLARGQIGSGSPLDMAIASDRADVVRLMVAGKVRRDQAQLDARAYDMLAKNKPQLLAALRAGGADPARYARNNPQALYAALLPGSDPAALEFALKAGADPNRAKEGERRLPIVMALNDEAKLRLLLKYGADPNARDVTGYTLLAQVLFAPSEIYAGSGEVRHVDKLERVRLLLGAGANPNGDHGGWGRYGALGATRRDDKDVIALLVARGATLAETEQSRRQREERRASLLRQARDARAQFAARGATAEQLRNFDAMQAGNNMLPPEGPLGGPLVLALGMERDDLALALLSRDKKILPQDGKALSMAAQRGARELVQALLVAGADPNAADERGITPMTAAKRRRDEAMLKMLVAAGAKPDAQASQPRPALPIGPHAGDAFAQEAARILDDVALFDPPRFGIGFASKDAPFAFYGKTFNRVEAVRCERAVRFGIIAFANEAGNVSVGVCEREARHVHDLTEDSSRALDALIGQFAQGGNIDREKAVQMGWSHAKSVSPDGEEVHVFPLLVVGHGLASALTVVVIPRDARNAVVVQAEMSHLCGRQGMGAQTPLCGDTKKALTDIALRISRDDGTRGTR